MLQYLEINHIHVALLGLTISTSSMSFYNHSNKSVYQPMDSIPTCTTTNVLQSSKWHFRFGMCLWALALNA